MNNELVKHVIEVVAGAYGPALQALSLVAMAVGSLRMIMKPSMAFLEKFVVSTPSKKDDDLLQKVEGSAAYKTGVFVLDYVASIKIPVVTNAMKPDEEKK